ncbi:MAG: FIST signal transduction protein, partial [Candidatus Binatia bacterium]
RESWPRLPDFVAASFPGALLIGCSAGGVIGGGHEVEGAPGLSITAALLPGVRLDPIRLEAEPTESSAPAPDALARALGVDPARQPRFLLLSDPFSFDAEPMLRSLDEAFPAAPKVGGLASGGHRPGANALLLGGAVHRSGLVGVALSGDVELDTIVAQGCRPIGEPMFVTRSHRNVLFEIDGRRPLDVLRDLYQDLDARDRALFEHSLFVGLVMDEHRERYRRGDFLVRNLIGVDESTGSLAVAALVHDGAIVQFHLRDADTSAEDLEQMLSRYEHGAQARGSVLFSCLGRGRQLYGRPDHDTDVFRRHLGELPLGGFFCNGEIGPVQGRTFLHGYTSSFGLFRPR